jgi:hypothetical protein
MAGFCWDDVLFVFFLDRCLHRIPPVEASQPGWDGTPSAHR